MRSVPRPDQLKAALKSLLKEKDIQYVELAERLSCSVPTIKRILGPEELTLSRLLDICDVLEIKLSELEAIVKEGALVKRVEFTPEQDAFFAKNTNYLAYYSALHTDMTPAEIATKYGLTKKSTDLYLIRLEKLGLLTIDAKGRVRLKNKQFPGLSRNGELMKTNFRAILDRTTNLIYRQVSKQAQKEGAASAGISVSGPKVSVDVYKQWVERINELQREIRAQADFEEKYRKKPGTPMAVISFMHVLVDHDDPDVESFNQTLGEITNL